MLMVANEKYSDYDYQLGQAFASLIAEFFHIPESEAVSLLNEEFRKPGGQVANDWKQANPQTQDEITRFYQETGSYIYDLAADHCHVRRQPVRDAVIRRIARRGSSQNVLMYGDGIGTDSIEIAKHGHKVTYFDLPGITSDFARFRFKRDGLEQRIGVVNQTEDIPKESFDVAVCIEVLEHVPDPPGVMRLLYQSLKQGGIALITESFDCVGPEYPSHLPENFQYAGRTHALMEGIGFANTYYNHYPLNRPMEFTKAQPGFAGHLARVEGKLRRALDTRWRRIRNRAAQSTS